MKEKYLTVQLIDDGTILPMPLCCGIVDEEGNVTIPEHERKDDYYIYKTEERRSINSKGNGRGKVGTLLVCAGYTPPCEKEKLTRWF